MSDISDVALRRLSHDDLPQAFALSSTAGWNQRVDDWRLLIDLAPTGGFAAVSEGRIIGTAIGIDYTGFSWIAMMLVDRAYRGRGLGRRLLEAALDAVPAETPVRLDATPMGRPLYRAYGFEDEAALTRCVAASSPGAPRAADGFGGAAGVRRITSADLPAIARRDSEAFGGNRRMVLEWALDSAPEYAHVIEAPPAAVQYCFGRRGRLFDQIGPVVAAGEGEARALVRAALHASRGHAVVMDVFDERGSFAAWLQACGFHAQRPLFRMRRRPRGAGRAHARQPIVPNEFAILGPEFA